MEKEKVLTNETENKRAIKASVDQAKKNKDEYWIAKGNFKKGINLFWQKQKKEKKKWKAKHGK